MPVSLWLRPEAPLADAMDAAIAAYATVRGLTPFPAHLTLASGEALSDEDFSALAASAKPIQLELDGCLETAAFFQVFALRFHLSPDLMALRTQALSALATPTNTDYVPHLSLTYGLPIDREALLLMAKAFDQPIRFDRIIRISYDALEPSQAAVAAWRLSDPLPLGA